MALGAWALLIGRYTGAEPASVGVVRARGAAASVALPLTVSVDGGQPVGDWLRGLAAQRLALDQHGGVSAAQLQTWGGDAAGPFPAVATCAPLVGARRDAHPLLLDLASAPARLRYDAQRYSPAAMARLVGHFTTIRSALAAGVGTLGEVPSMSAEERDALWKQGGDCDQPWPRDVRLHDLITAQTLRTPNAEAAVDPEGRLTYAELMRAARRLASELRNLGVGPGDLVAIRLERSRHLAVSAYAVLQAGAAYVPFDAAYPVERCVALLQTTRARVLITHRGLGAGLEEAGAHVLRLDVLPDQAITERTARVPVEGGARVDDLAYVIFTSGSTGTPKGVMIEHSGAVNTVDDVNRRYAVGASDRVLALSAPTFDLSVYDLFGVLAAGGCVVFPDPARMRDPAHWLELVRRERITLWNTVPAFMEMLVEYAARHGGGLETLRLVMLSGDWVPVGLPARIAAAAPAARVVALGGATEASIWSVLHDVITVHPGWTSIPYGRAMRNQTLHVLDPAREPCALQVAGELYIGGSGLARGYWNAPEITAAAFIVHARTGERLYRTGDRGRRRVDGEIEFLGRADHQVKIRGFRIEPGEVEVVLGRHPAVRESVVLAREDSPGDRRLVGYVVPRQPVEGGAASALAAALRQHLGGLLPEYLVPSCILVLAALPLSANGKVDRRALPAPSATSSTPPRTPIEKRLAAIWGEVLGVEEVGADHDFFALGGHSLPAMRVLSRLGAETGVDIPLQDIFAHPLLADCARAVRQRLIDSLDGSAAMAELETRLLSGCAPSAGIPRLDPDLPAVVSPAQEGLWFLDRLAPGGTAYNLISAHHLHGALREDLLEPALELLRARHPSLRTVFAERDGRPVQVVEAWEQGHLRSVDLAWLAPIEREAELERLVRAEAARAYDLAHGPLFRALLVRMAEHEHVLVLAIHHIVADGWSLDVMLRDLAEAYNSLAAQTPLALPELATTPAEVAAWQRDRLASNTLADELAYWTQRLQGAPARLRLSNRSGRSGSEAGRLAVRLSPATVSALRDLAQREGASLFMVLFAAFAVLLMRWSGQRDLLVGTPVSGRERPETEGLVGFLINMLVLRVDAAGDPSFRTLLGRVRESCLGAFAHPRLPYEALVEALNPERDADVNPLFQVVFIGQSTPRTAPPFTGLRRTPIACYPNAAKFDLTVEVDEDAAGGLECRWEYRAERFAAVHMQKRLARYLALLDAVIADPEKRLAQLVEHARAKAALPATRAS